MGADTKIEWADATVNFWTGCTKVSAACDFCYAEALAKRMGWATWGPGEQRHRFKGAVALCFQLERKAIRDGRPLFVFINSLSDTFDAEVPDEWRDEIFAVAALCPHLIFLLLTKRPKVAREYITYPGAPRRIYDLVCDSARARAGTKVLLGQWPLPNVWLGTTVENQKMADLRIPDLLATPAAKRFLSCEPLLKPIELGFLASEIDWIIAGGESGQKARPSHPDWFRSLREQCLFADVPFFFKQWGEWTPDDQWRPYQGAPRQRAIMPDGSEVLDDVTPVDVGGQIMTRVGKKAAGRLLDGALHNARPAP